MWLTANETGWGYWRIQVLEGDWYKSGFFPDLLATRTDMSLFFSVAGGLPASCAWGGHGLIVSVWRQPYSLQCDVYWTLIQTIIGFTGTVGFLDSIETTQKFKGNSKGYQNCALFLSYKGTSEVQTVTKSRFSGSWRYSVRFRVGLA